MPQWSPATAHYDGTDNLGQVFDSETQCNILQTLFCQKAWCTHSELDTKLGAGSTVKASLPVRNPALEEDRTV